MSIEVSRAFVGSAGTWDPLGHSALVLIFHLDTLLWFWIQCHREHSLVWQEPQEWKKVMRTGKRELGPEDQWMREKRSPVLFVHPPSPLFLSQIWTSVPYLASYVSPVIKENKAIPLSPHSLEVLWNGK